MPGCLKFNPAIGLHFSIAFFNPMAGFVQILPKIVLKQPSIFYQKQNKTKQNKKPRQYKN